MGNLLQFRQRWPSVQRRRWRRPSAGMVRLVVLLGIAAALYVRDGLGIEMLPRWTEAAAVVPGRQSEQASEHGGFIPCRHGNPERCVVDGDTIHYGGAKIRLEDIDAPETYQHKCASELALGQRATNRLLELVNAGPFAMVRRGDRDVDRYGRKLRTIERDGRSLGDILVGEGLARRWDGARHSWCG